MTRHFRFSLLLASALVLAQCGGEQGPASGEPSGSSGQPVEPQGQPGSEGTPAPTPGEQPRAETGAGTPAPDTGQPAPGTGGAPEQPAPGTGQPPVAEQPAPPAPEQPAPGAAEEDAFGVTMLYPTQDGGEEWYLADDAPGDARFNPQEPITRNADGSWKMRSSQVRMGVYTSDGYRPAAITTYNRDELAKKGYMQSPKDWKNVEITGFVKLNAASDMADNFAWYARGGRHTDDNSGCEGSAYKGDLYYDGRTRWAKETWHVSYEYTPYQNATTAVRGRWVGFKAVMYNVTVNGQPAVKMESYLNDNADRVSWRKVHEYVDAGNFGGDASHCGASDDAMPITWGGPTATFRWDSATDVDFKWLSVREIAPPAP